MKKNPNIGKLGWIAGLIAFSYGIFSTIDFLIEEFSFPDVFKQTLIASIWIPASIIIAMFLALRDEKLAELFDKWQPKHTDPFPLMTLDGSVIVGVLILLTLSINANISELSRSLIASVVIQFTFSAMLVAVAGDYQAKYKDRDVVSWGYKVGLLMTIPAFITLIITRLVIGSYGVDVAIPPNNTSTTTIINCPADSRCVIEQ